MALMHPVDELLTAWRNYIVRSNRGKLGYAMGGYAERVGKDAYGDTTPDIDPDVLRIDGMIRNLPGQLLHIIWLHYIEPGPVKAKRDKMSEARYYERLSLAKELLRSAWDDHKGTLLKKTSIATC